MSTQGLSKTKWRQRRTLGNWIALVMAWAAGK